MYPTHLETDVALVRKVVVGSFDNNCYWIACKETGEAALVDVASEAGRLTSAAAGMHPKVALITHGHWDHVQAISDFRDLTGCRVGIGAGDSKMVESEIDFEVGDGDIFRVGNLEIGAIATPGHTPGGISYKCGNILFSGDTLFPGGPGNTKGGAGNFDQIINSIESRLFTLDAETIVLPGHGLDTTIGTERPHLDEWISRGW